MTDEKSLTQGYPQITVNGQQSSQDRIDPNVAMFIMQAAQTAQLVKLRKLEESKIPTGVKSIILIVPDSTLGVSIYPSWISFSLRNEGPGGIVVWINDSGDPLLHSNMVNSNDYFDSDMIYPVISKLYLRAESGTTATVRIFGKEGIMRT